MSLETAKKAVKPPDSPKAPQASIDRINALLNEAKNILDGYSLFIRALDYRFNEAEDGKLDYLGQAYEMALADDDFLPYYLTLERFGVDVQYFVDFRNSVDLASQVREKLWNITIQSADLARKRGITWNREQRAGNKGRNEE
jgi:hypothetical protein